MDFAETTELTYSAGFCAWLLPSSDRVESDTVGLAPPAYTAMVEGFLRSTLRDDLVRSSWPTGVEPSPSEEAFFLADLPNPNRDGGETTAGCAGGMVRGTAAGEGSLRPGLGSPVARGRGMEDGFLVASIWPER